MPLPQPVALITGASAGIGAALARVFAAEGHTVALAARRADALAALADEIAGRGHSQPHVLVADLATPEGPAQLTEAMRTAGLEPAYVVNNAGYGLLGAAARADRADTLTMVDLNMRAVTDLSLRFLPSVRRHRGGILNVASIAAFAPGPGMAVYHATKAYVLSFTEALHEELKVDGVRACVLCPGPVETGFNARGGIPNDYFPDVLKERADLVARAGYDGFMGDHRVVVPGKANRIFTLLPRLLPRGLMLAGMELRWARVRYR
jgi:short-subunit dehydrogenase